MEFYAGRLLENSSLDNFQEPLENKHLYNKEINWGGHKNLTFDEAAKLLFHPNYNNIEFNPHLPFEDVFIWPHGFCKRKTGIISFDEIMIATPGAAMKVFITDPGRSLFYKISETSQVGSKIILDSYRIHRFFQVKVVEKLLYKDYEHCSDYGPDHEYISLAECVEEEGKRMFVPLLGCMIPWMSDEQRCTQPVFMSTQNLNVLLDYLLGNYNKIKSGLDLESSCLPPCHQLEVQTTHLRDFKAASWDFSKIYLMFENNIARGTSAPKYSVSDLLVEVGSSLGLWLGLSVIGSYDLIVLFLKIVMGFIHR